MEAKRALTTGETRDRVTLAAARRLAAGGTVGNDFLSRATAHAPGPIARRWMGTLNPQSEVEGKDAVDYSDGIMIALMLPESLAETIALPDGQPATELHVTLAFLGTTEDINDDSDYLLRLLQAVRDVAEKHGALTGVLSGTGRFIGDDGAKDVYYVSADVPGLEDVRYELMEALGAAEIEPNKEHGFTPHVTLAYVTPDAELPPGRFIRRPVEFEDISVVYGTNVIPVRLGGDPDTDPEARLGRSDPLPTTTSATVNTTSDTGGTKLLYDHNERVQRRALARMGGAR